MKYFFILLCLPQLFGVALDHEVSNSSIMVNTDFSNNKKFDMTALVSTLTTLSVDPAAMLNVITLLTHMIYEASTTLAEIDAEITREEANLIAAQDDAARIVADAARESGEILGAAQGLLDAAVSRRDTETPTLNDEVSMLYSVITTLGGDNLDCLNGHPADSCGHVWVNRLETDTLEECLHAQRANYENSIQVLGIMHRTDNRACWVYDVNRFDQCEGLSWVQSDFVPDVFTTCRVVIE
jgi:hypothetical protein